MGLIDIFKKKEKRKEQSKCAQCLRPIAGSVYTIDSNNYCRECYNRKMAVIQQTCGQPATVTQKIPPKKSAQNKLPVAERCARCFDNIPAEQRIKAYQAKYELGEFDFETMTFMECADDQHHFVDLKHFNGGSNCKCQKCNLVIQFNRGAPDRIEPKEWKAFIEKYKGSKIDFYYPPYSNEGMKDLVSIWSNWKERLPDYLSKKEYIELGFLSETVEVEPDGYGGIDKIFYFENGAFHTCLRHWDGGNFTANRSYNRTVLCKQDFIKILEDKKAIILCELPNAEKAKFESVFEDVKEILFSFA